MYLELSCTPPKLSVSGEHGSLLGNNPLYPQKGEMHAVSFSNDNKQDYEEIDEAGIY